MIATILLQAGGGFVGPQLITFGLIAFLIYFFLYRPYVKRQNDPLVKKQQEESFNELQKSGIIIATKGKRLINEIIDICVIFLLIRLIIGGMLLFRNFFFNNIDFKLFSVFVYFTYYFIFEIINNRTVGKLFTNTKVIDENGGKPNWGHVLVRTLCRLIPFEPLSFLGVRGWHDSLSKTMVISNELLNRGKAENQFEIDEPHLENIKNKTGSLATRNISKLILSAIGILVFILVVDFICITFVVYLE